VVVLTGPATAHHIVAAADALSGLLPMATRRTDGDPVAAARALAALTQRASSA
jgi:hypothetical protein